MFEKRKAQEEKFQMKLMNCKNVKERDTCCASQVIFNIRVGIKGSWFVNHESISWSHQPKISKTSIFCKLFFPKYDDFKINSTEDICLSVCLELNEWVWTMKEQSSVNYVIKY